MFFPYHAKEFEINKSMQPSSSLSRYSEFLQGKERNISIVVEHYFCKNQIPIKRHYYSKLILSFDEFGKIIQSKNIDNNNNQSETHFRYDIKNNLTYVNDEIWKYSLNKELNKITITNKNIKWEKEYDERGRMIKSSSFVNNDLYSYDIYEYDEENRITKWLEHYIPEDDYGNETNNDIQLLSEKSFIYKKQFGNKILCTMNDFHPDDKKTYRQIYIINPDLTVYSHKYLNKNCKVTSEVQFDYKYLNQKILEIKESQINYRDNPKGIITEMRKILYYYE